MNVNICIKISGTFIGVVFTGNDLWWQSR